MHNIKAPVDLGTSLTRSSFTATVCSAQMIWSCFVTVSHWVKKLIQSVRLDNGPKQSKSAKEQLRNDDFGNALIEVRRQRYVQIFGQQFHMETCYHYSDTTSCEINLIKQSYLDEFTHFNLVHLTCFHHVKLLSMIESSSDKEHYIAFLYSCWLLPTRRWYWLHHWYQWLIFLLKGTY